MLHRLRRGVGAPVLLAVAACSGDGGGEQGSGQAGQDAGKGASPSGVGAGASQDTRRREHVRQRPPALLGLAAERLGDRLVHRGPKHKMNGYFIFLHFYKFFYCITI